MAPPAAPAAERLSRQAYWSSPRLRAWVGRWRAGKKPVAQVAEREHSEGLDAARHDAEEAQLGTATAELGAADARVKDNYFALIYY